MSPSPGGLFVQPVPVGPMQNLAYLVGCGADRTCAVVDAGWEPERILDEARRLGLRITDVLCTHSHYDHVGEAPALVEATDARVHMLGIEVDFSCFRCENLVRHAPGDRLGIGRSGSLTFVHTPGHTPGSTSFALPGALVTGDTLFVNGCGRCDLVGGDPERMYQTLRDLVDRLPPDTAVFPGHDYGDVPVSSLAREARSNPYLQHHTLESFLRHRMPPRASR